MQCLRKVAASKRKETWRAVSSLLLCCAGLALPSSSALAETIKLSPPAVVRLPSPVAALAEGGAGRYVVAHLEAQRLLAIVDLRERRVAHYVRLGDDPILMAAGRDKLVTLSTDSGVIQRWSLETGQLEVTRSPPTGDRVNALALGAASEGPLLLHAASARGRRSPDSLLFLELSTLRRLPVEIELGNGSNVGSARVQLRASGDGSLFGLWTQSHSPNGFETLALEGSRASGSYVHRTVGHLRPGPDGREVHTARELYTPGGEIVGSTDPTYRVPSSSGPWYLSADLKRAGPPALTLGLHIRGVERRLVTLELAEGEIQRDPWTRSQPPYDRRLVLAPAERRLAHVPPTLDRVEVYDLDIEATLANATTDILVVRSLPQAPATAAEEWSYQIDAFTNRPPVAFRLEAGPPGMNLSSEGLLSWSPAQDASPQETDVVVTLRDQSDRETFHAFKVRVVSDNPPGSAIESASTPARVATSGASPTRLRIEEGPGVRTLRTTKPLRRIDLGGDGRWLAFADSAGEHVSVVDLSSLRPAFTVPTQETPLFAAGAEKLILVLPRARVLQRWDLATGTRERAVPLPIEGTATHLALGAAATTPVLVRWVAETNPTSRARYSLLDTESLTVQETLEDELFRIPSLFRDQVVITPSVDGGTHCLRHSHGIELLSPGGGTALSSQGFRGHCVPVAQGMVFTDRGLSRPPFDTARGRGQFTLPAVHGNLYLSLSRPPRHDPGSARLSVHVREHDGPILTVDDLGGIADFSSWSRRRGLPAEQRVLYLPNLDLLVTVEEDDQRLVFRRFDLLEELRARSIDYLFVASVTSTTFTPGARFESELDVWSRRGGVTSELVEAPPGMSLAGSRKLVWDVPVEETGSRVVRVRIKDRSGQEILQEIHLHQRISGDAA